MEPGIPVVSVSIKVDTSALMVCPYKPWYHMVVFLCLCIECTITFTSAHTAETPFELTNQTYRSTILVINKRESFYLLNTFPFFFFCQNQNVVMGVLYKLFTSQISKTG